MTALARLTDWLARALFWLAMVALAAIVAVTCFEVLLRYLFDAPTHWAADSVGYLLAASIMLALPEVTRQRGHVAISFLAERMPNLAPVLALVAALVSLATAWIIGEETARQAARLVLTQGAAPIPKAWITGAAALGIGLSGLVFLTQMWKPSKGSG